MIEKELNSFMKISVITPVYNSQEYLYKCINSIIKQTYTNWELILVDDGSTDNSAEIIEEFAKNDSRVVAMHQKNMGPGVARNTGINRASGDYIVFIDSDDYIDKEYFELINKKSYGCDVIFIDVNQINQFGQVLVEEKMSIYKDWDREKILKAQMTGKIPWGGVRKVVKLSLLREYNIKYSRNSIGEEALYSFKVLFNANKIGFIDDKPVYFYLNHIGSQSKKKLDDPWGDIVDTYRECLQSYGILEKYARTLNTFNATATVVSLDRICQNYSGTECYKLLKLRIKKYKSCLIYRKGFDLKSASYKCVVFIPFLNIGIVEPVVIASFIRQKILR